MIIPVISWGLMCCQGNRVIACLKLLILKAKCMKILINGLIIIFFGKWPWYKQDDALWGIHYQEWMDLVEANVHASTKSIYSW